MSEKNESTDQDAHASSVLNEIVFFVSRFFLVDIPNPTIEDTRHAELLAKSVIRYMTLLNKMGVEKGYQPVFQTTLHVKQDRGIEFAAYTVETIGGELYGHFGLRILAKKIEKALGKWNKDTWGGTLTKQNIDTIQAWSGVGNAPKV